MFAKRCVGAIAAIAMILAGTAAVSARPPFDELSKKSDVIVMARLFRCADAKDLENVNSDVFVGRLATFRILTVLKGSNVGDVGDQVGVEFVRLKTAKERNVKLNALFVTGVDILVLPDLDPNEKLTEERDRTDARRPKIKNPMDTTYLLFLKRSKGGNYAPTTGVVDSAPSSTLWKPRRLP